MLVQNENLKSSRVVKWVSEEKKTSRLEYVVCLCGLVVVYVEIPWNILSSKNFDKICADAINIIHIGSSKNYIYSFN